MTSVIRVTLEDSKPVANLIKSKRSSLFPQVKSDSNIPSFINKIIKTLRQISNICAPIVFLSSNVRVTLEDSKSINYLIQLE